MAAYISVPRDLTKVKSKVAFNLTKRQLVCFGTAALIGVPLFFVLRDSGGNTAATLGMMAVMLPAFFLGMYEKNGQPHGKTAVALCSGAILCARRFDLIRPTTTTRLFDERRVSQMPFWKKTDKRSSAICAKAQAERKSAVPRTAQQSIPMQRMFEDGTCRVKPNYYTRTIQYQDINYQLAQQEDKTAIFEEWCSFLNFFDSSIKFELSFVNMATDSTEFEKSIRIPFQKDGFDDVRAEYSQMLRQQLAKGNNGLTKTKFITFGVEGESMAQVKPRLDHIQNDLLNNFHRLGVQAKPLNGAQRLKLMHDMFNMDGASKFHFDWKDLVKSGLSVKDAIVPTAFAFKNSRTFQMGGIFCAASFLSITASDISDQLLKDFLDMDSSQIVTMHIQSVDQNRAIKTVKRTITELDRSKIEEQKKAIRAGYDIDIIPSDLATYGRDAKALLKELQSQNERMFLVTFLVLNTGRTEQELENNVFQASSIAQKHNCNLCRLDFQQEQGLDEQPAAG